MCIVHLLYAKGWPVFLIRARQTIFLGLVGHMVSVTTSALLLQWGEYSTSKERGRSNKTLFAETDSVPGSGLEAAAGQSLLCAPARG